MRVAFTLIGGRDWTGGYNYLLNLLRTLTRHQKDRLTPVLFVNDTCTDEQSALFASITGLELVRTSLLNPSRRKVSLLQSLVLGRDIALQGLFRSLAIDVVFEAATFYGWRLGIPAIAWIPDFQHKVLPDLFSRGAWWRRELGFQAQIRGGRIIMLSSEDARLACERFYPATRGRTHTVHFAVSPGSKVSLAEARLVADARGLPEEFFFLPNQFWRHKNHDLVLDALALLKQRGQRIVVASSGRQADTRDPQYFQRFIEKRDRLGLQDEFRLLGLIPYSDLIALMRACTALLNPSLFEGWSTTVEEARAMGTPMLLSDLAVHREQMCDAAQYFDRHSAQALADALETFTPLTMSERERRSEAARQSASQKISTFAENFVVLADSCCLKDS